MLKNKNNNNNQGWHNLCLSIYLMRRKGNKKINLNNKKHQ